MALQAGNGDAAVRRAMVALGNFHRNLLSETPQESAMSSALDECRTAISQLVQAARGGGNRNGRLMLTTYVLLTAFEALQGNVEQAIGHASQGQLLLQQFAMVSTISAFQPVSL
jgi:hypothetical protein